MRRSLFHEQAADTEASQSGIAHDVDIVGDEAGGDCPVRARTIVFEFLYGLFQSAARSQMVFGGADVDA